jgi:hypothetical protein
MKPTGIVGCCGRFPAWPPTERGAPNVPEYEREKHVSIHHEEERALTARKSFTTDEARRVGEEIGIDWGSAPFDVEQFRIGMDVELEHGLHDPLTNVTDSDPVVTGKIALAHLNEFPDYYTRLARMEDEASRGDSGG